MRGAGVFICYGERGSENIANQGEKKGIISTYFRRFY